jgi:predicted transposase YdaD
MVEEMLCFEIALFRAEKISARLLAAAMVMSNKMVDKKFFEENLEVLKMIDVIDVAREHGIREGKNIGIEEGKNIGIQEGRTLGTLETGRKMLLNLLMEKFGGLPPELTANIRQISDQDFLEFLFSKAIRCESVQAFEQILSRSE